jgi:hypothetical protein
MGISPAASATASTAPVSSASATPAESVRVATAAADAAFASAKSAGVWACVAREASTSDPSNEDKAWTADAVAGLAKDANAYAELAAFTLDYVTTAAANAVTAETPEDAAAFEARAARFAHFIEDFAAQAAQCAADAERFTAEIR